MLARTPAGRWGVPDDFAGIAVFLASAASDFVTGTAIPVDGGYLDPGLRVRATDCARWLRGRQIAYRCGAELTNMSAGPALPSVHVW